MKVKMEGHVEHMNEGRNTHSLFTGEVYVKGLLQGRIIFQWISEELAMKQSTKCLVYQRNFVPTPAKAQSDRNKTINPAREIYLLPQSGSHISLQVIRIDAVLEFH
jgi:hypothetical protein